ncbi:MAG: hypothetical protein U9N76_08190 [Candidatus Marinimicrobia bacterium]|nr:hypothetical protein [Candidatus Neomarinimicrobiota bacterium]
MKKFLTIVLVLSMMILSSCWFGDDDNDGDGNEAVTESFLVDGIWYFSDVNTTIELTTNSNQTAINSMDKGIGGITISGNAIGKNNGSHTLSYFHYVYWGPTYKNLALEDLGYDYPDYFLSYYSSIGTYSYESFDLSVTPNDSTYNYYNPENTNNASFDTTNYTFTVSADTPMKNTNDTTDIVTIESGTLQIKQVDVPANTPTILNTPIIDPWVRDEMEGVSLNFNSDGTVYLCEENDDNCDTATWTLDDAILTIIDEDTMIINATNDDGKLALKLVDITDQANLKYIEDNFHLDEGSLTSEKQIENLLFSHTNSFANFHTPQIRKPISPLDKNENENPYMKNIHKNLFLK